MRKVLLGLAASIAFVGTASAEWTYFDQVPAPDGNIGTIRLAADSTGRVYLSRSTTGAMRIYYTDDILAATVDYTQLVEDNAMANGFQGLVVDADDNVYVLGESGTVGTGTLRKFDSNGDLVTTFGTAGVATPSNRLTGLSILSNGTLIATTFGGQLYTFDPDTGAETIAADTGSGNFVRDIAVRPDTVGGVDEIYATRSGSLVKFTGGTVDFPTSYTVTTVVSSQPDASFQTRPGVHYNASDDTVIFGNYGNAFNVVDGETNDLLATLTQMNNAADPFVNTSDAVTIDGGDGYEYLILSSNSTVLSIYRWEIPPVTIGMENFDDVSDLAFDPLVTVPTPDITTDTLWQVVNYVGLPSIDGPITAAPGGNGEGLRTAANNALPAQAAIAYQTFGNDTDSTYSVSAMMLPYYEQATGSGTTWGGIGIRVNGPVGVGNVGDGYFAQVRVDNSASFGSYINFQRSRNGATTTIGRYYFVVGTNGIQVNNNGDGRAIRDPQVAAQNTWMEIKLVASGDEISLVLDDELVTTFVDADPVMAGKAMIFHEDPFNSQTVPYGHTGTIFDRVTVSDDVTLPEVLAPGPTSVSDWMMLD